MTMMGRQTTRLFNGTIVDGKSRLGPHTVKCACGRSIELLEARTVYRCSCSRRWRRRIEQIIEVDDTAIRRAQGE